jgi:hypothetical protein
MAERTLQIPVRALARRRNGQVVSAIVAIALAGPHALGGPPPLPALLPDRARLVLSRVLGVAVVSVPIRTLARWIRLCLAPSAIRGTPPRRSDTPALPTVGRPRDAPLAGAAVGESWRERPDQDSNLGPTP